MPAFEAARKDQRSYFRFSRIFSYLLQPQWIAVATASLVLLLAVPIFVILKNARQFQNRRPAAHASSTDKEALLDSRQGSNPDSQSADQDDMQSGSASSFNNYTRSAGSVSEPVKSDGFKETAAGDGASGGKAGTAVLNGVLAPAPATTAAETNGQKTEAENRPTEMDNRSEATQLAQNKLQQNGQQPSANESNNQEKSKVMAATGPVAQNEQKQLARDQSSASPAQVSSGQDDRARATKDNYQSASSEQISPRDAQTLPDDNKKSAVIVRPGAVSGDARAKDGRGATIRPKDSEPPKSESTRDEKERGIAKKGPAREFATGSRTDADTVRKPATPPLARSQKVERRVENKRFRLVAGIWTDKDFKPYREIPAVTLVRDSEVYKSALEKQPGLKGLLAGFGADERIVVVYKNIVYKVVPPKE